MREERCCGAIENWLIEVRRGLPVAERVIAARGAWVPAAAGKGRATGFAGMFGSGCQSRVAAPGGAAGSVEEVAIFLDMSREAERVLAHEPLGKLAVARLKSGYDRHVIGH